MRAADSLNRTFRPENKKTAVKPVKEKHFVKYQAKKHHTEKKAPCISAVCPHCGKTIEISIK